MTELELLAVALFAGTVLGTGLLVALLWATRAVVGAVAGSVGPRTGSGVHLDPDSDLDVVHLEDRFRSLEHERHVTTGVVTDVVAESRRPGSLPLSLARDRREGVRVDVAIPTPGTPVASEWFPLPDELAGRSRLERLLDREGLAGERLSELLGHEVPVRKDGEEWRIAVEERSLARRVARRGVDRLRSRRV
jgi:hypothetical protein